MLQGWFVLKGHAMKRKLTRECDKIVMDLNEIVDVSIVFIMLAICWKFQGEMEDGEFLRRIIPKTNCK